MHLVRHLHRFPTQMLNLGSQPLFISWRARCLLRWIESIIALSAQSDQLLLDVSLLRTHRALSMTAIEEPGLTSAESHTQPMPFATESCGNTPANKASKSSPSGSVWLKSQAALRYIPRRCRYDPARPPGFSLSLNLLFSFAATFTGTMRLCLLLHVDWFQAVANLYYNHPILNVLAQDFKVTDERASLVPTLAQAGYAGGLLFCKYSL